MSTPILGPGPPPPPLPPPPPDKRRNPADKVVLPPVKGQKLRVKKKKRETRKSFEAWFARGTPTDEGELEFEFEELAITLEEDQSTTSSLIDDGPDAGLDDATPNDGGKAQSAKEKIWSDFCSGKRRRLE
ncbi:unnamed protein product [Penicillium bialowiezense]